MFQQFTLTDKEYWMSFFLRNISLHPFLQFLLEMVILLLYAMLYQPPPVTQNFASQEPLRDQSVELWQIFQSRIKLRPSEDLMTNHVSLLNHLPQ